MPAFLATASITRIPSGTTSFPIPSPSIAAIRYLFILASITDNEILPEAQTFHRWLFNEKE
jgi:hypothetical protein